MSNLAGVLALALQGYQLAPSGVHGPGHWLRVLRNGRELAARTPGVNLRVVEHFALLHDCWRVNESIDPEHGQRAAEYALTIGLGLGFGFGLNAAELVLLATACARHEFGEVTNDPTVGACWDADRLELARLGRRPIARLLSTAAALDPTVQAGAWLRGTAWVVDPEDARALGLP
jgi:uncharacterized protein